MSKCVLKTVSLSTGEVFVLPSDAVIIGVDIPANVTSSCGDIISEEQACYGFYFAESFADGGDAAYDNVVLTGITVGGITYPFSSSVAVNSCNGCIPTLTINQLMARLAELPIGGAFNSFTGWTDGYPNSGDASITTMICFKTFPSIAIGARISAAGYVDTNTPTIYFDLPVWTSDEMLTHLTSDPDFALNCGCN